jgi:hypothetical protein
MLHLRAEGGGEAKCGVLSWPTEGENFISLDQKYFNIEMYQSLTLKPISLFLDVMDQQFRWTQLE